MLKVGVSAPPIDAVASDGKRFALYAQESLCTVIYFFPKAFTPHCTAETKEFRKHYVELELAGATLVGVSTDDLETQCRFASELGAPFPIVPDRDRAICRAYDVLWPLIGIAHRITYIVAPGPFRDGASAHDPRSKRGSTMGSPGSRWGETPQPGREPSGPASWTVEACFRHEFDVGAHRDEVLRFVNAKFQSSRPAR
jgi:peroxiredoxin